MIVISLSEKEILEAVIQGMRKNLPNDHDGYLQAKLINLKPLKVDLMYWRSSEQN